MSALSVAMLAPSHTYSVTRREVSVLWHLYPWRCWPLHARTRLHVVK